MTTYPSAKWTLTEILRSPLADYEPGIFTWAHEAEQSLIRIAFDHFDLVFLITAYEGKRVEDILVEINAAVEKGISDILRGKIPMRVTKR